MLTMKELSEKINRLSPRGKELLLHALLGWFKQQEEENRLDQSIIVAFNECLDDEFILRYKE